MSNLVPSRAPIECPAAHAAQPMLEAYPIRESDLGDGLVVRRALPQRKRRLVGPWCFFDHFGPIDLRGHHGLDVAPHPHIGLQTVTWLLAGEVLHKDSLGYEQLIRPGQLILMTAGRGIAHSEETPAAHSLSLHGVQLWVALPYADRNVKPAFEHQPQLPTLQFGSCRATVLIGKLAGVQSPARAYSPIVGVEITSSADGPLELPLEPLFEHAILVVAGRMRLDDQAMEPGTLFYLGAGRRSLRVEIESQSSLMLIGGTPFAERIIIWWNFVARSAEEIAAAREDWERGQRFGEVRAYRGKRLTAPPFELRPKPR
jgi:redox-sensitive bicupin YhaK (pirin superfamily)